MWRMLPKLFYQLILTSESFCTSLTMRALTDEDCLSNSASKHFVGNTNLALKVKKKKS